MFAVFVYLQTFLQLRTQYLDRASIHYLMGRKQISWQPFLFGGLASVTAECGKCQMFYRNLVRQV